MLNRKQVIDLAEEAGLVFNTEMVNSGYKVTPRHGAALWKFYKLLKAKFEKGSSVGEVLRVEVDNVETYIPSKAANEEDN